jgi:hypothetical protein
MRLISPVIQAVAGVCGALALAALTGCGPAPETAPASDSAPSDPATDYLAPPVVTAVSVLPGRVTLRGHATPRSTVRLGAVPAVGRPIVAQADATGAFQLDVPSIASPRLVTLQMAVSGAGGRMRRTPSDGYVFLAPGTPATLLRAGSGARQLAPVQGRLHITGLDYDAAGGAVLSGAAQPGATLSAQVDGVSRGQSQADREGRFSIPLPPVPAAAHQFTVTGGGGRSVVGVTTSDAAPLTGALFRAERTSIGWRVDWMTPGGGLQTSLILD